MYELRLVVLALLFDANCCPTSTAAISIVVPTLFLLVLLLTVSLLITCCRYYKKRHGMRINRCIHPQQLPSLPNVMHISSYTAAGHP